MRSTREVLTELLATRREIVNTQRAFNPQYPHWTAYCQVSQRLALVSVSLAIQGESSIRAIVFCSSATTGETIGCCGKPRGWVGSFPSRTGAG